MSRTERIRQQEREKGEQSEVAPSDPRIRAATTLGRGTFRGRIQKPPPTPAPCDDPSAAFGSPLVLSGPQPVPKAGAAKSDELVQDVMDAMEQDVDLLTCK